LYPIDKERNADGRRRALPQPDEVTEPSKPVGIAPLLRQYMAEYAATGLPPAYIPLEREPRDPDVENDVDDNTSPNDTPGV
jgi:hypothetical protein